jgi:hypothetical protein
LTENVLAKEEAFLIIYQLPNLRKNDFLQFLLIKCF